MRKERTTRFVFGVALCTAMVWSFSAFASIPTQVKTNVARDAWLAVNKIEKKYNIPKGLLLSMSLVETGQGVGSHMLPWPYTVGINPTKNYTFTKQVDALEKLDKLRRIGFKRVDLRLNGKKYDNISPTRAEKLLGDHASGTVQLQGQHFSKRFEDAKKAGTFTRHVLQQGYDNVDIGLMQINWHWHGKHFASVEQAFDPAINAGYAVKYLKQHREERDWWNSVGRYHSGTKKHATRYIRNVYAMYRRVHRIGSRA